MTRKPTFKPDYGIEHPTARRARAGFWLVKWLVVVIVALAFAFWSMS